MLQTIENRLKSDFYDNPKIQKEIGQSSWFGFSMVVNEDSEISREALVSFLTKNGIEIRPIVAGNILHNPMVEYFDYSIGGNLTNADIVHKNGLFIGNHHYSLFDAIKKLEEI